MSLMRAKMNDKLATGSAAGELRPMNQIKKWFWWTSPKREKLSINASVQYLCCIIPYKYAYIHIYMQNTYWRNNKDERNSL